MFPIIHSIQRLYVNTLLTVVKVFKTKQQNILYLVHLIKILETKKTINRMFLQNVIIVK